MEILKNSFNAVSKADEKLLQEYFHGFDYRGAGYTLLANYIWREVYCVCWEEVGGYLFTAGGNCMVHDPEAVVSMPMTRDGKYEKKSLRKAVLEVKKRFDDRKIPFFIELIPGHMLHLLEEAFPEGITVTHDRDADEYVYSKDKLINLSGRALHKKKNHMNYFLKTYEHETRPLTTDMEDEIIALVKRCRQKREYTADEAESLRMEEEAIRQALKFLGTEDVYGTAIYIDGVMQAFAIGERLDSNTAVEHFEKADDSFRGLYQVICSEFCRNLPEEIAYVNREEDMGLEHLRKAKEALKPDHMEEKYSIAFY